MSLRKSLSSMDNPLNKKRNIYSKNRTHLEFEDKKNAEFLQRQWRKFGTADFDGNKKLAIKEFTAFLFPQYFEGTKGEWMQND